MSVVAVTPFQHGEEDGSVTTFGIGDTLPTSKFSEDQLREFVASGSAVDTTGKYSGVLPVVPVDADTVKRDELLAKQGMPVQVDGGNPVDRGVPVEQPLNQRQADFNKDSDPVKNPPNK